MGVTDPHFTPIGGEQEVRVQLGEVGKGGVIDRCEGAEGTIHEVGNGCGLHHGEFCAQDSGSIVPHTNVVTQDSQVHWAAGVHCTGGQGQENQYTEDCMRGRTLSQL